MGSVLARRKDMANFYRWHMLAQEDPNQVQPLCHKLLWSDRCCLDLDALEHYLVRQYELARKAWRDDCHEHGYLVRTTIPHLKAHCIQNCLTKAHSAGIISFLKLPSISGIGKTDIIETVPLVIWGGAESAVTILAASIPVLRLLIPRPNRHVNELDYRSAGSSARPTKLVDMDSSPGSVGLSSQKSMQTTTSAFEAGPQHSNFTPYRGDHLTSIAAALKSPLERSPGGMSQTMADMDSYDKDLPSLPNRTLPRSFGT